MDTTLDPTHPADLATRLTQILADPEQLELLAMGLEQAREALEGDSNDADHDALVSVTETLGLSYQVSDF